MSSKSLRANSMVEVRSSDTKKSGAGNWYTSAALITLATPLFFADPQTLVDKTIRWDEGKPGLRVSFASTLAVFGNLLGPSFLLEMGAQTYVTRIFRGVTIQATAARATLHTMGR